MDLGAMLIVGLVVGAIAGYLVARAQRPAAGAEQARIDELRAQLGEERKLAAAAREQIVTAESARSAAEVRAGETAARLEEQKQLLAAAEKKLAESFDSLAAKALADNNKSFLVLAEEKFKQLKSDAAGDLEARRVAVEQLVEPIKKTLASYQDEQQKMEKQRAEEKGALDEQLRKLAEGQGSLQQETAKLVNALRSPQVRGRWGEIALRRTAELAGMTEHCDFIEQASVTTENGRLRPDMVVQLPAEREVVVDSKVPLDGFLKSLEAKSDAERTAALDLHATQLRQHVAALASKQYWEQFARAPEFVVLFIPNDSFLAAAAERDATVIEEALARKVIIATPTTFIALLRAIAYGWRQQQVAESAEQISQLGRTLYERIATFVGHLEKVGAGLKSAVKSYNSAVGSLQSRLLPQAERFRDLGVNAQDMLPALDAITEEPRVAAQKSLPGVTPEDAEAVADQSPLTLAAGQEE